MRVYGKVTKDFKNYSVQKTVILLKLNLYKAQKSLVLEEREAVRDMNTKEAEKKRRLL